MPRPCLIGLLILSVPASLSAAGNPPKTRLSEVENIESRGYRAELTLDPEKSTFSGAIEIRMDIRQAADTVWLNQKKLQIQSATVKAGGKEIAARIVPGGDDFVGLRFNSALPVGSAVAAIHYTGAVNEKNTAGIFRQQDRGNWYLLTQFEATDARAAFPCFDEPSYKSSWQLTLHFPEKDTAIGNTPPASETRANGMKTVVFKETKPLPSYLVAFGVGPFEYVAAGTAGKNKVPVRIVVPKGRAAEAEYAAQVTATILTRLEDYFGIPYPYDKADQVAIPNAAGFGAMENPGMVTYDTTILLADPKTDRISRQRSYASIAAHELAHQWFGDLVTTAWWDDIWLNEAFATWMERKLIAEWKPEWQTRVEDVADTLHSERDDSLISSRKIRQEILTNDDINNAFDSITYGKGASVIGMFENRMGPEEFRKGVQSYLKQYAWQATTAGQFLDSLSSSSGKNVSAAFFTFLNQAGVPMVSIALECAAGKASLHLKQERFLPVGSKGSAKQTWSIPLCIRYGRAGYGGGAEAQSQCMLMSAAAETMTLNGAKGCPAWVEANDRAIGYYRVNYEGGLLRALTDGDVGKRLSATERTDLMGNASALSGAGKLSAADALALVETFHSDPERLVVQGAIDLALEPVNSLVSPRLMPNYQRFLLKNFEARARELGWKARAGESPDTTLLRPSLVRLVATWGGDAQLASEARQLTDRWLANHAAVDPNILNSVLATAAFHGDKALFDRFLSDLKKTQDPQQRRALLAAVGWFRDPVSIEAGMNALLSGDVPFIEGAGLLFNGQKADATRPIPLRFLKAHFDEIVAKMPSGGGFDFGSALPEVGASYCETGPRNDLNSFFQPKVGRFVGAPRALAQTLEAIDLCIAKKAAQQPGIDAFLSKY
jgi:alanyl aminopeptidase